MSLLCASAAAVSRESTLSAAQPALARSALTSVTTWSSGVLPTAAVVLAPVLPAAAVGGADRVAGAAVVARLVVGASAPAEVIGARRVVREAGSAEVAGAPVVVRAGRAEVGGDEVPASRAVSFGPTAVDVLGLPADPTSCTVQVPRPPRKTRTARKASSGRNLRRRGCRPGPANDATVAACAPRRCRSSLRPLSSLRCWPTVRELSLM